MKIKLLLLFAFGINLSLLAQNNDNIVSIGINLGPSSVYAADFDGDGDIDVLSAAKDDNTINWHENIDGLGNFSSPITISTTASAASSVYATDIDGDGDLDVLSASMNDDKIAWYENIDGLGTFGSEQNISTSADGASCVFAIDLDNDGDNDVLSASYEDDKIAWYENLDGLGNFGAEQIIATNADGSLSVFSCDLDTDGDNDVLSASFNGNKVSWYENTDGQGSFGAEQIIESNVQNIQTVRADDLDGDGDMDVVFSAWSYAGITWYENTDGLGNFVFAQNIYPGFVNNLSEIGLVKTTDMDNDGDMDIVAQGDLDHLKPGVGGNNSSNMNFAHKVAWYENLDGLGGFDGPKNINADAWGLSSVYPADINGDGDMDVVSASTDQDKISWHENIVLPNSSVNESIFNSVNIYPNPTTRILIIDSKNPISQIEIFNQLGQKVFSSPGKNQVDVSKLGQGVYFIQITAENGQTGTKKIVKN